jgi:hypothetical protein
MKYFTYTVLETLTMKKIKKQPPVRPEKSETPVSQFAMSFGMNGIAHIAGPLEKN